MPNLNYIAYFRAASPCQFSGVCFPTQNAPMCRAGEVGCSTAASHLSALVAGGPTRYGVTLGWAGISCATGPTPIGAPANSYSPSREAVQQTAPLGCRCWIISLSQSPHSQTLHRRAAVMLDRPGGHTATCQPF